MKSTSQINRRRFLQSSALAAATVAMPRVLTAQKSDAKPTVGSGEHTYEVTHNFVQLPDKFTWQITHDVAVDREGLIYVIHEGREDQKDHPSIFVFDDKGKYIRSFGRQFQGGGHGLEVVSEGKEQFLYVTAYQGVKSFAKLTLKGETVWEKHAPMESGIYLKDEDTKPMKRWGRDAFMPTNYAFLPDGSFYLADGYGSYRVHRYDKDANWKGMFGEPGKGDGQFSLPHGICIDDRPGREKSIVITDRSNSRLQWLTLDGKHIKTMNGFMLPANVDTYKDVLLVPDLSARITLLDGKDNVIVHLGEDPEWRKKVLADKMAMRGQPDGKDWVAGKFLHPHDACFDAKGNILVAEWVNTGRITMLRKVG
jgi:hypothetical protein